MGPTVSTCQADREEKRQRDPRIALEEGKGDACGAEEGAPGKKADQPAPLSDLKNTTMNDLPPTILATDTETSGLNTRFDVILEASMIRVDHDLAIRDPATDVLTLAMRRPPFVVPAPAALLVTGASLEALETAELSHLEGMQALHAFVEATGPAITCGHNLLRFDEEIRRHNSQMCLLPPYATQIPGSGRADTLVMAQAVHCMKPGSIIVPMADGRPTFRLGALLQANDVEFSPDDSHGAEYDCRAVIRLLALLKDRAPRTYGHMLRMAMPSHARTFLDEHRLFAVASHYGAAEVAICTQIVGNPANRNAVAVFSLAAADPADYLSLPVEGLMEALQATPRIIKTIRLNAQPSIFPVDEALEQGCEPDWFTIQARATMIAIDRTGFADRAAEAMRRLQDERPISEHVEENLYGAGFPSHADRALCQRFQNATWEGRTAIAYQLTDKRLRTHALRLVFCHAPNLLKDEDQIDLTHWLRHRLLTLDEVPFRTVHQAMFELSELYEANHEYEDVLAKPCRAGGPTPSAAARRFRIKDPALAARLDEISFYILGLSAGFS